MPSPIVASLLLDARRRMGHARLAPSRGHQRPPRVPWWTRAAVRGAAAGLVLVVLPSAIRIRNTPASHSGYLLSTGVNVRQVRVRIGDDAAGDRVIVVRPGRVARVALGKDAGGAAP